MRSENHPAPCKNRDAPQGRARESNSVCHKLLRSARSFAACVNLADTRIQELGHPHKGRRQHLTNKRFEGPQDRSQLLLAQCDFLKAGCHCICPALQAVSVTWPSNKVWCWKRKLVVKSIGRPLLQINDPVQSVVMVGL
ncbi:hypothetical protein AcV7_001782 [Taiwanofungus camphoratus]|nr:hypothetical protein AcV7_001782 [Antrodia cinnamomea]